MLAVLLCHSPIPHGEGGALGVAVFFVLSGYLITSLLAAELDLRGQIAFGRFYARRAWRLWPPLLALIVLATLLPANPGVDPAPVWQSDLVSGVYLTNFWALFHTGTTPGYLTHTWSLAVEEQFYLLWPIVLAWLLRRRLDPVLVLVPTVVLSAAVRAGQLTTPTLLPEQLDGLLLGALVALLARSGRLPRRTAGAPVAWVGLVVIVAAIAWRSATHSARPAADWAAFVAAIGAALLIANLVARPGSRADRLLSNRPLVKIGTLSYAIYLVHYPIFFWMNGQGHGRLATLLYELLLTVPAVLVCWLFIEKPARRMKARWSTITASDAVAAESGAPVALNEAATDGLRPAATVRATDRPPA